MRKIALIILVAMSSDMATFSAQLLSSGFYRVYNYGSQQYMYVRDCTGSAQSTATQDLDALELWKQDNNMLSDPGSVMYVEVTSALATRCTCNISSQNTGIHQMTNKNVDAYPKGGENWQLYYGGNYLYDIGVSKTQPGTSYSSDRTYVIAGSYLPSVIPGKYSVWTSKAISSSSSDNYFGFKPTVKANGKYYAPFFASFAYTPLNSKVKTWYVSKVDEARGIAVISEITGTVAANQAVFVECAGSAASDNKVDLSISGGTAASSNLMKGVYFCNTERVNKDHTGKDPALVKFDPTTMRVLSTDSQDNLSFVNSSNNLASTTLGLCIPHNTSYLTVSANCPATLKVMTEAEYFIATGISNVPSRGKDSNNNIYSVSGVKKDKMQKNQINIIGGKKVLNR